MHLIKELKPNDNLLQKQRFYHYTNHNETQKIKLKIKMKSTNVEPVGIKSLIPANCEELKSDLQMMFKTACEWMPKTELSVDWYERYRRNVEIGSSNS